MVRAYQKQVKSIKTIQLGLGFYYMMNYFVSLLRYNMVYDYKSICNNYTTVFSCVPGPVKAWSFGGNKVQEVFYTVPGVGRLGCGIGVITQGGKC